jgi:hypothetical protein
MNVVKKLVVCLVAVIGTSGLARAGQILIVEVDEFRAAPGAPVVVYDSPIDEFQSVNAKFDIDPELGRAWIDVEKVDSEFQTTRSTVNRRVNGLSYDPESKEVIYRAGGSSVVCGEATSFLGMTRVRATGNCPLIVSYENRTIDDGTRPSAETFAKVTLNPKAVGQVSER